MTELAEDPAAPEEPAADALALRLKALERGRTIVEYANRGLAMPEIAARVGMTESATRAMLRDVLARSMPESPEDFAAIQMSRLNEALLVAYGAMGAMNLKAVDRVVRIVRALDRYAAVLAARPLARTPALDRDAPPPALADDRSRYPIAAQGSEKGHSRSLAGLSSTGEAEARPAARPAEPPAPDLARVQTDARPDIPPQPFDISRFGLGFAREPAPAAAALAPPGLAASRWRKTAASVGALAAAGA
jgi:hypothetical protein